MEKSALNGNMNIDLALNSKNPKLLPHVSDHAYLEDHYRVNNLARNLLKTN